MKIKYSLQSVADLKRLHDFVAHKNPLSARKIAIEIQESVEKLKQFPNIGLPVSRAENPDTVRDLYVGKYTLRYQVSNPELIHVLRIWHNKEIEKNL